MENEWLTTTLEKIANQEGNGLVDGPFGSNLPASSYTENGIPVIRGSNLTLGLRRFVSDSFVYVSEETAHRLSRSLCRSQDIVFTKKGTLGQTGFIPKGGCEKYLISSNQMKLTVNTLIADPLYVYYYVSSPASVAKVLRDSESTGVPKTNLAYLKNFPIVLPTLPEQKAIAHILGTLDDKIQLNRRMNTTLEAMTQALFKSWFVDFDPVIDKALAAGNPIPKPLHKRAEARRSLGDKRKPLPADVAQHFPDSFVFDEEMGWVPEGWSVGTMSNIAELKTTSAYPNREPNRIWTHFSIPAFDVSRCPTFDLGETIKSGKYRVTKSCILASKLNPQFPRVWMPDVKDENSSVCSTEFMPFVPLDEKERTFLYSLLCSEGIQTEVANRVTGSTGSRQRVKPKEIAMLPLLVPSKEVRGVFSAMGDSLFAKRNENKEEENILSTLRNTLLPKLLSGQLRIPDAEKLIGKTAQPPR